MTTKHYPELEANPNFAALEEAILKFWAADRTFEKSVENRAHRMADGSSNAYVFYDGPPFANGSPHYGHLLTGYVKDAIARYHTMAGSRVERRFGWDCHGLPAEMGAEKELGISGRAAIAEFGIGKFNDHCRTSVMKYVSDWRYYVTRQGRWVDFDNDYKTMDTPYMESCLWAFSELYKKGLVYESMRVMPYSWAAETPVSNFETRIDNATREREDKAAYVKFKLDREAVKNHPGTLSHINNASDFYIVAWTTTPWTLPSNLALAVNPDLTYNVALHKDGYAVIALKSALEKIYKEDELGFKEEVHGSHLIGLSYEPLFPYFERYKFASFGDATRTQELQKNIFTVLSAGFVTEGDGTGIVHIAPGFGEEDQKVAFENGIPAIVVPVDEKGRFTDDIFDIQWTEDGKGKIQRSDNLLSLKGLNVVAEKDAYDDNDKAIHITERDVSGDGKKFGGYGLANMRIIRWLKANDKLVKDEKVDHNYPHCWRTDTPLIYRAMPSWYVNVQKIKANMAANNETIHWIPDHIQQGQMGRGIESAPDWSISRNRFWGTPIPIWRAPSGKLIVPGSIAEIEQLSGMKVPDLHRPFIDTVTFTKDGETYTRVEDVFDCWFESGSMPYAQVHYPFENKDWFEENFPADFITEYIAQTRGWFYTLQVLSAALFGKAPFKNVICHGVVIDEETGLKYSKRLKNYKDPKEVMDAYGADALRWMMLASPVMRGADLGVDPDGKFIRDVVRLNIKPLWSAFNFFTLYANADGVKAKAVTTSDNMLDRYILAKAKAAVTQVRASMDAYDTPGATDAITGFFEILNNWYIRRCRPRFWGEEMTADKQAAYDTLFTVLELMCRAAAPLLPFVTEAVYRGLHGDAASVHLTNFPDVSVISDEAELIADMDWVRNVCNAGSAVRNKQNIRNRQPLIALNVYGTNPMVVRFSEEIKKGKIEESYSRLNALSKIIEEELNIKDVKYFSLPENFDAVATRKLQIFAQILGKRLPEKMKQILPASKKGEWEYAPNGGGIIVAGEFLKWEDGEYNIVLEPKPEYKDSAQVAGEVVVILDLTITPELEAEGQARDLVRMIQQARKDAGLHVADRISLAIDVPEHFKAALATHRDYIAAQTLAVSLGEGSASAAQQMKQELDGEQFVIGLSKVA